MPVACQQGRIHPPQVARCTFDVSVEDEFLILGGIPMGHSVLLVSPIWAGPMLYSHKMHKYNLTN